MNQQGSALLEKPFVTDRHGIAVPAAPAALTRNALLDRTIKSIERGQMKACFQSANWALESVDVSFLRRMSIYGDDMGTTLHPLRDILHEARIATGFSVGDIMDSPFALAEHEVHLLACHCLGETFTGLQLIERLSELKTKH